MFNESTPRISPEVRPLQDAADIAEFFRVADPILHVDWGDDGVPAEYTPEYIVAHPDQTQIFAVRDMQTTEIVAGAKVTVVDEQTATRLQLSEQLQTRRGVLGEYGFVREGVRGNGVLEKMTNQSLEWARAKGVEYMCAELSTTDPRAIGVQLRKSGGFVLLGVCPPGAGIETPYFVAVRPVDSDKEGCWRDLGFSTPSEFAPSDDGSKYEWDELPLDTSFETLQKKFSEGWYGVDLRGTIDQGTESSVPWSIVFERQK